MNSLIDMKKGLLLVAHGSRKEMSNDEIRALTQVLQTLNNGYEWLDCAFLELTEPKVETQIQKAIEANVKELVVYPHFLAAGYHVVTDLPEMLDQMSGQHPEMSIRLIPHLGQVQGLAELILNHTQSDPEGFN